ncbi:MAG: Trk system potassium transporter TrkA [Clostridia bacterium]|nr:Trk system potassium transporter TrkA [Clostridia bacterium]
MRIIIVGLGKLGTTLAEQISGEDHDVTVIDTHAKLVEETVNRFDVFGVVGSGADCEIQKEAGVDKCDIFISVTQADELNILACMISKKLGARHTIARVRSPEYSRQFSFMRHELGISMLVNPEYDAAFEISRIIQFPSAMKVERFAKGRVDLAEIALREGNPLCGQQIRDVSSKFRSDVLICAVIRGEQVMIPSGDFRLERGDRITLAASHNELSAFFKTLGILKKRVKSVMIIGGGKIAYYLAKRMGEIGVSVKIIDINVERCRELAGLLPKATVIHADASDSDVLTEEGLDNMDACVTLTGIDEENIIISMFAAGSRVEKVITKVNRPSLVKMMSALGQESIVSPRYIAMGNILSYLRARSNSDGSSVRTMYKIADNMVEAIEFYAAENFGAFGVPIKKLHLKPGILIGCIIRSNKVIFPHGDNTIELHDSVIVITTNQALLDLRDILAD